MIEPFAQLLDAAQHDAPPREFYRLLQETLHRAVDAALCGSRVVFAGLFAKVEHLVKERGIALPLAADIGSTRDRLRRAGLLTDDELARCLPFDLRTVCEFVRHILDGAVVPEALRCRYGDDRPRRRKHGVGGGSLRVRVTRWNDLYIEAKSADGGEELRVSYSGPGGSADFHYIRPLLQEGSQLNLVRPHREEGMVQAELLILEPDLLIDISGIAACFTEYAESAVVSMVRKITPSASGRAILLGNFAGQLLDEAVHGVRRPYADSITDFFRENALDMAAATDLDGFHADAQRQRMNILRAIDEHLPASVGDFRRDRLILEPSFFCELLGVQGRMDFLQTDYHLLIEQKSGSAAFGSGSGGAPPRQRENHYVQLLLYRAVLHYGFRVPQRAISSFLLYSKYERSLLRLGSAPELLAAAFRVRNEMAWCEMSYARGGFRLLERLTPEAMNRKGIAGRLWTDYIRPSLAAVLDPVRAASPLERAYFFRFMEFVATEHLTGKFGNLTKEGSGFASLWHDTLEERRAAGNIYDGLVLVLPAATDDRIAELEFRLRPDLEADTANFRRGDAVVLYPYAGGEVPDVRRTMVFRAAIAEITAGTIRLRLRGAQIARRIFRERGDDRWAVEHDFMDATTTTLYRGLAAMLSAPRSRRDLMLAQRKPEVNEGIRLSGDYGAFNELVLRSRQARDLFLIVGPPGTGKTSHGLLNIVNEELRDPSGSVLLLSFTHRAVDEICGALKGAGIDFLRLGTALSCDERYRPYLLEHRVGNCRNVDEARVLIRSSRVVCATTATMAARPSLFALRRFSLAVVDEASQILEPHLCGLVSATTEGRESIGRFVLIGDHRQLPAVVGQSEALSRVDEPALRGIGLTDCRLSLFERFIRLYGDDPSVCYMLTRQGRMHREIADFPNRAFYAGRLDVVPLRHQTAALRPVCGEASPLAALMARHRVAFIDAPLPAAGASDKANAVEAEIIADLAVAVARREGDSFDAATTLGVIVPYRNQISTIRAAIASRGIEALNRVNVDTVERYQGSQREVIIYGFTASKSYQLDFLTATTFEENGALVDRKLNVAMTRAREHLLMVGHAPLLRRAEVFARLLDYVEARGALISL